MSPVKRRVSNDGSVRLTKPTSTLLLLVTCSRDESRRNLAVIVTKNLAELVPDAGLEKSFVVFDNASTFQDHLAHVPRGAIICRADRNIGYWSAIKWMLDNQRALFDREFDYLYVVESDLYHFDLAGLAKCEAFLAKETRASGVRTQEFSVRWRWRYDKRLCMLPFHVVRSQVSLSNAVTGEKAWFQPVEGMPGIFLSNLHPKLPALNRITALDGAFKKLAGMTHFTEADFFRTMMEHHPLIGVCDGGLFYSLISWEDRHDKVMASYTDPAQMAQFGYKTTRQSRIDLDDAEIKVFADTERSV